MTNGRSHLSHISLNYLLELITILGGMPLYPMEIAPSTWFRIYHIHFSGRRHRDVVQMEYLAPYLLMVSVQIGENMYCNTYLFKYWLFLYGWDIVSLPQVVWALIIGNTVLDVVWFIFCVAFLALYIAINSNDHFYQRRHWLLEESLIEASRLKSILELPHKHFLVSLDDPDGGSVVADEIVLQRLRWILVYIKQTYIGHLQVAYGKKIGVPIHGSYWYKHKVNPYTIWGRHPWEWRTTSCISGSRSAGSTMMDILLLIEATCS